MVEILVSELSMNVMCLEENANKNPDLDRLRVRGSNGDDSIGYGNCLTVCMLNVGE